MHYLLKLWGIATKHDKSRRSHRSTVRRDIQYGGGELAVLTGVVRKRPFHSVEDKPALFPGLDLPSHLDKVAFANLLGEDDVVASLYRVT